MNYPGIDKIQSKLVFRMMGSGMQHRLGAGFIKKHGVREDQVDRIPQYYSLSYVIRGKGEYIDARGIRYTLSTGSVFQRLPEQNHSTVLDPKSNWAECFIDFGAPLFRTLDEMGVLRSDLPVFSVSPMISYEKAIYQLMLNLETALAEELPSLFIQLLDILGKIHAARIDSSAHDKTGFIRQACNMLIASAADRTDLRTLIESHGWGYEWFRKEFRRELGISPGQYLLRHRLEQACNLILSTDMTFSEIADKLGYKNPYDFSSQFSKYLGKSPGKFRKEGSSGI